MAPHYARSSTSLSASPFLATAIAPAIFVVLWATGFIAGKAGLPFAPPLTFLALRFGVVTLLMLAVVALVRAPWPRSWAAVGHIAVVGLLMHGAYLGGVFTSLDRGLPAGLSALIVGIQPLLTATMVGPLLGERVNARQWLGLGLGLAGVAMVLADKLAFDRGTFGAVMLSVLALLGITAGTLYQKRFSAHADMRTGAVIQYAAAGAIMLPLAVSLEQMQVDWTWQFIAALTWLSVVLSLGAVSLLYWLIRHGAAAKVASLFYLVPPFAALFAWLLLGETLGPAALAGMAIAAVGVAMVQRG
ncbi:MAG TPA: DMT family transporter [Alphaproteobacteria bacterium]|jgi:drug/metabolite transporter (DMT)-like permease|nr:DMT family transporter [Alphaproteobacteria bacterium]